MFLRLGELSNSLIIRPLLLSYKAYSHKSTGFGAILILLITYAHVFAAVESGIPEIRKYSPNLYHASSQNWVAVQDKKGILYFGNSDGVLKYDGVNWQLIRTPKKTAVRALAVGKDGRIYVGGQSEFGYLAPDSSGVLIYHSLVSKLRPSERQFTDVWHIYITKEGVYFVSTERLFRLGKYGFIQSWKAPSSISNSFLVDGKILIDDKKDGLMGLDNDVLVSVPNADEFANLNTCAILPYKGSTKLVVTDGQGLFLYDGRHLSPFKTYADSLIKQSEPYVAKRLLDGTYLIGTLKDGLINIDKDGYLLRVINKNNGLQDNSVLNIFEDQNLNVWAMHENGISRISWFSPFSYFPGSLYNIHGNVESIARYHKNLYVATGVGVYELVDDFGNYEKNQYAFHPVKGINAQAWKLLTTSQGLIAATSDGVYIINNNHSKLLSAHEAYTLFEPANDSTTVFAGLAKGVSVFNLRGSVWKYTGRIPGIKQQIRSIYQDHYGLLWMGTDYQGVVVADYKGGGNWDVETYGPSDGLPSGQTSVIPVNGNVYIGTEHGFYRPVRGTTLADNEARFGFKRTNILAHPHSGKLDVTDVYKDSHNRLWFITQDSLGYATRRQDGAYDYHSWPFRKFIEDDIQSAYVDGNTLWLGGDGTLIEGNLTQALSVNPTLHLYLTKISDTYTSDGRHQQKTLLPLTQSLNNTNLKLRSGRTTIRFDYSIPGIGSDPQTMYRYRLKGYDSDWSGWSSNPYKEYTNLTSGSYQFDVQARNSEGFVSHVATFGFEVMPPWYKTEWAYIAYMLGILLLWYVIDRARLQLLRHRNVHLEEVISERTEQVLEQNEKLEESNVKLQRINELQKEFLSTVSHDLRNPLSAIQSIAEILSDEIENGGDPKELLERNHQAFKMINDSALYMSEIISNLLDVSAIESGRVSLQRNDFDMVELLHKILPNFKNQAERKDIHIEATTPEHCIISADHSRIRQVMENLISNAIKYSPQGSDVLVGIYPESIRVKNGIRFSVSDDGPGLSEEDKNKLFRKFQKLSATPTGGEKSTGLGLYITRSLVEMHNGEIWVESKPGKGATFNVELPVNDVNAFYDMQVHS